MISMNTSNPIFHVIAEREVLAKVLYELSFFSTTDKTPLYKTLSNPHFENVINHIGTSPYNQNQTESLKKVFSNNDYARECLLGLLYSWLRILKTFPVENPFEQMEHNIPQSIERLPVDDIELVNLVELAQINSSLGFKFSLRSLNSWKSANHKIFENIYQDFVFYLYKTYQKDVDFSAVAYGTIVESFKEYFWLEQFEKELIDDVKKIIGEKLKEVDFNSIENVSVFIDRMKNVIDECEEELGQVGVDHRGAYNFLFSLHNNLYFMTNCKKLSELDTLQFQKELRLFFNLPHFRSHFDYYIGVLDLKNYTFEVKRELRCNFYKPDGDDKYKDIDLTPLGIVFRESTEKASRFSHELYIENIAAQSASQAISEAKYRFNAAIDIVRFSENSIPLIELSDAIYCKRSDLNRWQSSFNATFKPWISNFEGRLTESVDSLSKYKSDRRPISKRYFHYIKLLNSAVSSRDNFLKLHLLISAVLTIFENKKNTLEQLAFFHFFRNNGEQYNNETVDKMAVFERLTSNYMGELNQVFELNETLPYLDYNESQLELSLEEAADSLLKYSETVTWAAYNALVLDDDAEAVEDIEEYYEFLKSKLEIFSFS